MAMLFFKRSVAMPKNLSSQTLEEQKQAIKAHKKATSYLNKLCQSPLENDQRMYRLYRAAECHNPNDLATFFDVSTIAIAKAKKTGKIPAEWLLMLFQVKNVFPEWIQTGLGSMYCDKRPEGHFEDGHAFTERMEDIAALRRLSSRTLTDELLRRIALS